MKPGALYFFSGFLFAVVLAWTQAQALTLQWDASPSAEVVGYIIYYGQEEPPADVIGPEDDWQFAYRKVVPEGLTLELTDLPSGQWWFAATAYSDDAESAYSNIVTETLEAAYPPESVPHTPVIIPAPPGSVVTIQVNVGAL